MNGLKKWQTTGMAVLALAFGVPPSSQAETETVNGVTWTYSMTNDEVTVTKASQTTGNLVIPATLQGFPVTAIGDSAFSWCDKLTSVTIPEGVTNIGAWSFSRCKGLTEMELPTSVTCIGEAAFSLCHGLTNFTISENVTNLGEGILHYSTGLVAIAVAEGNAYYESEDGVLFDKGKQTLLQYPGGKTGSYDIPESVTRIGAFAFDGCESLTQLTFPDGVTTIGQQAFYSCSSLTELSLPAQLTDIAEWAFAFCVKLSALAIPDAVTNIGNQTFFRCDSLTSLEIPKTWYHSDILANTALPENCVVSCRNMELPVVDTESLPSGKVDEPYRVELEASSGTKPYTWDMSCKYAETQPGTWSYWSCPGPLIPLMWWDDDQCWDLALPFAFPFFGNAYTNAKINSKGAISFGTNEFTASYNPYLFPMIPSIAVFWCNLTPRYSNTMHLPWTEATGEILVASGEDAVQILWHGGNYSDEVSFSAILHADGTIVLSYGAGWYWGGKIGLSAGNGATVQYAEEDGSSLAYGDIVFSPCPPPGGVSLDPEGVLRGTPEMGGEYSIPVLVTDAEGGMASKELTLSVAWATMEVDGITWSYGVSRGKAIVVGATPAEGALRVPESLGSRQVVAIGPGTFENNSALTRVELPSRLKSIGSNAFANCSGLVEMTVPKYVVDIGCNAFSGCTNLTAVYIYDIVEWCDLLFGNNEANPLWYAKHLYLNGEELTGELVIPDGVSRIAHAAFYNCTGLVGAIIPDSVESIDTYAFADCTNLANVNIPYGVSQIGSNAFCNCTRLESMRLPVSVTRIGCDAFKDSGLATLYVPESWRGTAILDNTGLPTDCNILYYELDHEDLSFREIWGTWSDETTTEFTMPDIVRTWNGLARAAWTARDVFARQGVRTEVPPSEESIVLSLGAIAVPISMLPKFGEEEPVELEHGVPVWRLHLRENETLGSRTFEATVAGKKVPLPVSPPSYPSDIWVQAVYGEVPTWLDAEGRAKWFADRSRTRIEWFATLVSMEDWATYAAERAADAESALAGENPAESLELTDFEADREDNGLHNLAVRSGTPSSVRLMGKSNLTEGAWTYRGVSMQKAGTETAGIPVSGRMGFWTAVRGNEDTDRDGIPDALENLIYGSNPARRDTAGGGLSDWERVYRYGLDPRVVDTAGDGISDAEKIATGRDPSQAVSSSEAAAARTSIRYNYDADDRLIGVWFGLGGGGGTTTLTPAGNPENILNHKAAQ